MKGRFYLSNHHGKGNAYAAALVKAGYQQLSNASEPDLDFVLYDHDIGKHGKGHRNGLDYFRVQGIPFMLYPHSARSMVQWDTMYPVWPHTLVNFTIGEGQKAVMEAFDYPIPIETVGWTYCEQQPFKPKKPWRRIKVLFGPIHPNNNGWLSQADKDVNFQTFEMLLNTPGLHLTVRHIKRIDLSGIYKAPGVEYVMGKPNQCIDEIDAADVVIGHQTFAYLAAARGKPLIMFGEGIPPRSGNLPDNFRWVPVQSWMKYRHIMQYPLEIESTKKPGELREMMERAMTEDVGAEWRKKFIGEQFDGQKFVKLVEKWLGRYHAGKADKKPSEKNERAAV